MNHRTKFAVGLVALSLVLCAGIAGGLVTYQQRAVADERADVNQTASVVAAQIDVAVAEKRDFVGLAASRPAVREFDTVDAYLLEVVRNSRFFAAQVVDANGTVVAFRGDVTEEVRRETLGSDVSDRSDVRAALAGRAFVSDPEYAARTDAHLVRISAPIVENGSVEGALVAALYLDSLLAPAETLETADRSVAVRAASTPLRTDHRTFENPITGTAVVEETGWRVTVSRDRSDLTSRLRSLAVQQGFVLLVVLLATGGYSVWEYRTVNRQTGRLLDGFEAIEAGEYGRRLSLSAGDEWRRIAAEFNHLAVVLGDRESELEERRQRLDVLYRALRHNLRNDVSVVLGYAEQLRERATDPDDRRAVDAILHRSRQLTDLAEKAKHAERASTSANADRRPVDVSATAEDAVASVARDYPAVDVALDLERGAFAYAVPHFRTAVANAVENACEHLSHADGRVELSVERTAAATGDPRVLVRVADNGPGIPVHETDVLERGRETPLQHGSGLGLWLIYWAVSNSGGDLRFEENDPTGTVLVVELDAVPADEIPEADGG